MSLHCPNHSPAMPEPSKPSCASSAGPREEATCGCDALSAPSSQRLSVWLMEQLADTPGHAQSFTYVEATLSPLISLPAQHVAAWLRAALHKPEITSVLEKQHKAQNHGHFAAYPLQLEHAGRECSVLVTPRPVLGPEGEAVTATLSAVPPEQEERLALLEERYRSITDNLSVGIAMLDADMQVSTANPRFTRWFGGPLRFGPPTKTDLPQLDKLFCSMPCTATAPPVSPTENTTQQLQSDRPSMPCQEAPLDLARRSFRDGQAHEDEFLCHVEDRDRAFRVTACPIRGMGGSVRSVILLLEDVTERKRVAERLNRARQLEAMGTLAAGIAHEINQPLSALRLYASGLELLVEQQRAIAPETLLARLGWILREADTIHDIIAHMRSLVMQKGAPPTGRANLNKAVDRALGLIGAQLAAHGVQVQLLLAPDLPDCLANIVQLEQVVINLVVNAMHALDTLDTQTHTHKWIRIGTTRSRMSNGSPAVQLSVADNGPGLTGLESRIFDPFFTTKNAEPMHGQNGVPTETEWGDTGGMGLGLSIVHTFVDSWRGEIETSPTAPGSGATFTITLREFDDTTRTDTDTPEDTDAHSHS